MACALKTDLYQLTMMAGYWSAGLTEPATFELFVRRLPPSRSYLIVAGVEQALEYLEGLAFADEERAWLKALPQYARVPSAFFDEYLAGFRFRGDVWAIEEGTPVFAGEPILRVTAAMPEAQLVETELLSTMTFQTSVATKASRVVEAARGRPVIEFGARRAHGPGAARLAARAAYIGGCDGTSYVEAAQQFGIPASGTMAHSWVQAFPSETEAFDAFGRLFADSAVYLLDTYDTHRAAETLIAAGLQPPAVRIDSGDLVAVSRDVRQLLDQSGLTSTRIFATSDLDERRIAALLDAGAPIDAFGVGTALTTVDDAPALAGVYKLVDVQHQGAHRGVIKLSPGKPTWPGPKQVWRTVENGVARADVIAALDEPEPRGAAPLLSPVMRGGRRTVAAAPLAAIRERCRRQLATLPAAVRRLDGADEYPVHVSETLERRRRATHV